MKSNELLCFWNGPSAFGVWNGTMENRNVSTSALCEVYGMKKVK